MAEITINNENFEETIKSNKLILIDFYANWCGPCKMLAPILAEIADEYSDKLAIGKVNVDENMELAQKFYVEGIPMAVIFKDGVNVDEFVGFKDKDEIVEILKKYW